MWNSLEQDLLLNRYTTVSRKAQCWLHLLFVSYSNVFPKCLNFVLLKLSADYSTVHFVHNT